VSNVIRSLVVRIGVDLTEAQKGFKQMSKDMALAGKTMSSVGGALTKGIAVPAIAAVAGIGMLVNKSAQVADGIRRMADVTGLSTDRIQELQYAGNNLGVDLETITGAQSKLIKAMVAARKGTEDQAVAFKRLGVSVTNSDGSLRNSNDVFAEAIDRLGAMSDETERDALSLVLFGRSALELNPLIKAGSTGLRDLTEAARENGAVMSEETVNSLDAFGDSLDSLKQELTAAGAKIAEAFLPVLDKIGPMVTQYIVPALDTLAKVVSAVITTFEGMTPLQQNLALMALTAAVAIGPLLSVLGSLATTLAPVVTVLGTAAGAAVALGSGIAALVIAMAAINTAIFGWMLSDWNPFSKWLRDLLGVDSVLTEIWKIVQEIFAVKANPTPRVAAPTPGFGKANRYNKFAEEAGSLIPDYVAGTVAVGASIDYLKSLADNKAAAALESFRDSVKSLAKAMIDATKSFANFSGAFGRVERQQFSGTRLANRMKGQLKAVQDWAEALKAIKGKVSGALYSELRDLGPGAVDELMALARDDQALADYAGAWQQKYNVAASLGVESAKDANRIDQNIESQVNTINVIGSGNEEALAKAIVKRLRLAGA
jgi:hypothetical protein